MGRELPSYREYLERLDAKFPETEVLTIKDIMDFCNMTRITAMNHFPFSGKYISKINLAHRLAEMGK